MQALDIEKIREITRKKSDCVEKINERIQAAAQEGKWYVDVIVPFEQRPEIIEKFASYKPFRPSSSTHNLLRFSWYPTQGEK